MTVRQAVTAFLTLILLDSHLKQMSVLELDIDNDHPLALELSSLRTAVARFQVRLSLQ